MPEIGEFRVGILIGIIVGMIIMWLIQDFKKTHPNRPTDERPWYHERLKVK